MELDEKRNLILIQIEKICEENKFSDCEKFTVELSFMHSFSLIAYIIQQNEKRKMELK